MNANSDRCEPADCSTRHAVHEAAWFAFAAVLLLAITPAAAQDTRAEAFHAQQAAKQDVVTPPRPTRAEVILQRLGKWGFLAGDPRGMYPWVGSVFSGGGIAAGAGLRVPFGDDGALNVSGGYSLRSFRRAEATAALPSFAQNRAHVTLSGQYVDAPDVRYHGVGNDTAKADRTAYGYRPASAGARLDVVGGKYLSLGGGVNYLDFETSGSRTRRSIEEVFSGSDTPGLHDKFAYINSSARAVVDWRRAGGYSGTGGLYRAQFDHYRQRHDDGYSFRSIEAEVRQLVPILRANWVVALRGLATLTDVDHDGSVPFFLLPSLGGGSTLRGYPDFRFRDRNRLLMSAELRWTPARFIDMATFYDTGKVAARRQDLNFNDLHDAYGLGMRIVGPRGYAFRVEIAHSREHRARLLVGAGGTF